MCLSKFYKELLSNSLFSMQLVLLFSLLGSSALFTNASVAATPTFVSKLVKKTDTSQWFPSSPDPAGITYLPSEGRLLISDSEVNEMPLYQGVNLFKTTLSANVVETSNTLSYSNEPTGLTFKSDPNPAKERLFVSDDDTQKIYVLKTGPDGLFGTSDDAVVSQFSTLDFGSIDPEGVAFDSRGKGTLFIVDGLKSEVYKVTPGSNGIFDGVAVDDIVSSFDTKSLGIEDLEGITFDTNNNHLYIVGEPQTTIAKVSTNGILVQNIDISAAFTSSDITLTPAGLTFAPASNNPNVMNLFIVNRGVDNDNEPSENDGKLYEMTLPPVVSGNNPPVASNDTYTSKKNISLNISTPGVLGNDTDDDADPLSAVLDDEPNNGSLILNSNGSFAYTPNLNFIGTDSFTYHANDGQANSNLATVSLVVNSTTVVPSNGGGRIDSVIIFSLLLLSFISIIRRKRSLIKNDG